MTSVLSTAASMPVAAWLPATMLYSPCHITTSRMLPPERLYSHVSTIAPQVRPSSMPT